LLSTFCFTFDQTSNGRIHSQTIVSTPGHKFLVVNATDLVPGASCDSLVKVAKVVEPLVERSTEVIAYDLTLNVEPSLNGQQVAAVIARCGQEISAEYIIEFDNPGSWWVKHFSCGDLGLLQKWLSLSLLVVGLLPIGLYSWKTLERRQVHNDLTALFFMAAFFLALHCLAFTVHIVVYAKNGTGLAMIAFVAQFLDLLANCMLFIVMLMMAHGVYITRSEIPQDSDEMSRFLMLTGVFSLSHLVSGLQAGFSVEGTLWPLGVASGYAGSTHALVRAAASVFLYTKAQQIARQEKSASKKTFVFVAGCVGTLWLLSVPLCMAMGGGPHAADQAFTMEVARLMAVVFVLFCTWPSRLGRLFDSAKPNDRFHPYAEFGLED